MLDVLKFIFEMLAKFISMLFDIDLGFTSLGIFMCIIGLFFPLVIAVVNILKYKMRGD